MPCRSDSTEVVRLTYQESSTGVLMSRYVRLFRGVVVCGLIARAVAGCSGEEATEPVGHMGPTESKRGSANVLATMERLVAANPAIAARLAPNDARWVKEGSTSKLIPSRWRRPGNAISVSESAGSVQIRLGEDSVRWTLLGLAHQNPTQTDGSRLLRPNAFTDADLVVSAGSDYVEELIFLRTDSAPRSYLWKLELPTGWKDPRRGEDGGWVLADETGTPRLGISPPIAVDAAGAEELADMSWTTGRFSVELDTAGLQFPIVLDPNIYVWQDKTPSSGNPAGARGTGLSFDSARQRAVRFGGATTTGNGSEVANTYEWNGTSWTLRCPFGSCSVPPGLARAFHSQAYDSARNRTVVFGGGNQSGYPPDCETWEWNGSGAGSWTQLAIGTCGSGRPAARTFAAMAFDGSSGRNYSLLFGGADAGFAPLGDLWSWNGTTWTLRCNAAPCSTTAKPSARYGAAMAYDSDRNRVVLFGGHSSIDECDTWEYPSATGTWVQRTSGGCGTTAPPARFGHTMAYNPFRKRVIMAGGASAGPTNIPDTWEFDGAAGTWTQTVTNDPGANRRTAGMAFDTTRRRAVLSGGQGSTIVQTTHEYYAYGGNCTAASECDTGFCVDGVCCTVSSCPNCSDCSGTTGACAAVNGSPDAPGCPGSTSTCVSGACKLLAGQPCSPDGAHAGCQSGQCRDGVCCNTACTTTCFSCALSGSVGTCSPIPTGPDTGCLTAQGKVCQAGTCKEIDGQPCSPDGANTACNSGQCSDGVCCNTACSGGCDACAASAGASADGTCTILAKGATGTGCSPYLCGGTSATCPSTCSVDGDCATTHYCSSGACVPKVAQGGNCSTSNQCQGTLLCSTDGVCCNSLCDQTCRACRASNKQSGADPGVCDVAKVGTNPGNKCIADTVNVCGSVAACASNGTCAVAPFGKSCGPTSCSGTTVTGKICDGTGTCVDQQNAQCTPYVCAAGACTSPCTGDTDCVTTHYCETATCVPKAANGTACSVANSCTSGFCVDGVCCDAPCTGQCQACGEAGSLGQCKTIAGDPRPGRQACTGTGACKASCDGGNPTACTFPGSATECKPASCAGDTSQPAGFCDSAGACTTPATQGCLPYTCDAGTGVCKSSCSSDLDCGQSAKCDTATGKCAVTVASCKDAFTVLLPNGTTESCTPYKCVGGACQQQCSTKNDCATGYDCQSTQCVALTDAGAGGSSGSGGNGGGSAATAGAGNVDGGKPKPLAASDDSGCGCRTAPVNHAPQNALWLSLVGMALALRRRRVR